MFMLNLTYFLLNAFLTKPVFTQIQFSRVIHYIVNDETSSLDMFATS